MEIGNGGRTASRRVLADHVYDILLETLIDGKLEAGASIGIDSLSRQLEVSPTPVREALARLESTGLVRRIALKGYSVAPMLSRHELQQLMEARLVLEPVNAALTAAHATPEFIERIAESVSALETAPRGPSYQEFRPFLDADEQFHSLIAKGSGNPFLHDAYVALGGQVHRFRLFGGVGVTDGDLAVAEHASVLEALQAGDGAAARDAMTTHVNNVRIRALREHEAMIDTK